MDQALGEDADTPDGTLGILDKAFYKQREPLDRLLYAWLAIQA